MAQKAALEAFCAAMARRPGAEQPDGPFQDVLTAAQKVRTAANYTEDTALSHWWAFAATHKPEEFGSLDAALAHFACFVCDPLLLSDDASEQAPAPPPLLNYQ